MFRRSLCVFVALFCGTFAAFLGAAPLPADFADALSKFRAEGTKGWRFVQTTKSAEEVVVERFDPALPDFKRWKLLQKNGRNPTEDEIRTYNELQTRRSSAFNAPRIQDQIDVSAGTLLPSPSDRAIWRFPLKQGGSDDSTAAFMTATVTFYGPAHSIEQVELTNIAPFSPGFGVKILESRTVMTYSLPTGDQPSLLKDVSLHIRGRAFWVKSLDQDMTLNYSEHAWAGKKQL